MITAVDTSVLIAISNQEASWQEWENCLSNATNEGDLVICPVVFAEYSSRYTSIDEVRSIMHRMSLRWSGFRDESSFLAGQMFDQYRRNKGPRRNMIPDFLIAAHAQVQANRLAAIDRGYLRRYFPDLSLLTP